jgi:hypothetical protein
MRKLLKRFLPSGEVRGIFSDDHARLCRADGSILHRASRVEVGEAGPSVGRFHVDFSLLADHTGNEEHRVCLVQTFETHREAVTEEVRWLNENYLLEGLRPRS